MSVAQKRERILPRVIESEMRDSFLDYSMSVIVQRALPDVRDGLKPVHRRILFAMHGLGLRPDRPHKKSATVVGEVLGKYHPHGDSAVYDALVRMVQEFALRYPLVDGQGNFGSIDGDSAAAYRYTEARLSLVAREMLAEIEKDTVRWESNFDDRLEEPTVLPSRIPNLLVNGSAGIAVGMSTNVPPHNLREVAAALRTLVANPACTVADLMNHVKGPDFPTGGFVVGRDGIRKMYETGRGRMTMRARMTTEAIRGGRKQLIVTELPYAVSKLRVINRIAGLARTGALPDVADLRDESDREGMRLVVELKRGANPAQVMPLLFKKTALQCTFGAILLALDGGKQPGEFTLKELLERYRDHRLDVIRRRCRFELEKAEADLHIVRGLLLALDHIDEVIAVIRQSADREQASERLQHHFGLDEVQADAILGMRLAKLTALEGDQLRAREAALVIDIRRLRAVLGDEKLQLRVVLKELDEVVERFGDERRTEILGQEDSADLSYVQSSVADENVVVVISRQGYAKRIPMRLYQRRVRSGMSQAKMDKYPDDYTEQVVVARSQGWLLVFTRRGRVHFLRVEGVPEGSRASRGRSVYGLLEADRRDAVVAIVPVEDLSADRHVAIATRMGIVKRTRLAEFSNPRPGGLIAMTLRPGDEVLNAALTSGDAHFLMVTRSGRGIRFAEDQVKVVGRTAQGVKGVKLRDGDQVAGLLVLVRDASVLMVTEGGVGKRTPLAEFSVQKRGGLGMQAIFLDDDCGGVVAALEVLEDDQVMLVSAGGALAPFAAREIGLRGRNTLGQELVAPAAGDRIAEVTRAFGALEQGATGGGAGKGGGTGGGDGGDVAGRDAQDHGAKKRTPVREPAAPGTNRLPEGPGFWELADHFAPGNEEASP